MEKNERWPEVKIEIYEGQYLGKSNSCHFIIDRLFPLEGEDYNIWAHSLTNIDIEGAIQMYYDLWNFGSGSRFYKEMVDCLTKERTRRQHCYNH